LNEATKHEDITTARVSSSRGWLSKAGVALALTVVLGCQPAEPPAPEPVAAREGAPKLVLLLVVDQFRADYVDRFGDLFTGGLRTLIDEGVVFENSRHEHSYPATGPGHATLATGEPPRVHGIVGNGWFTRAGDEVYCAEGPDGVASPENLRAATLGDWMKAADPQSLVYTASGKDRAAILMGGRQADGAFWYDRGTGGMKSSSYYGAELPAWVAAYNAEGPMDRYFGTVWLPLPVDEEELESRGIIDFDYGPLQKSYPHTLGSAYVAPTEGFYYSIYGSPWVDRAVGRFAERMVESVGLGADDHTDLLALSFSALDTVGHDYGPHGRETLDTLLRLDRRLGELFDVLDERIGRENYVTAFSADHGAAPIPEIEGDEGPTGTRVGAEEIACLQKVERSLDERFGDETWLTPGPFIRDEALAATGIERSEVEQAAALLIESCPSVERVWTRSQLTGGGSGGDDFFRLFQNGFHPDVSADLIIQWEYGFVNTRGAMTTHKSPYDYDLEVPILFVAPGEKPRRQAEAARTMDVAPTLAALAGIAVPENISGRSLIEP